MVFDEQRASGLLRRLMMHPDSTAADLLSNDLLREFHRGYPIDNLRSLLHSAEPEIVIIGAWIASELGEKGSPLLADVLPLLHHAARKVRFSAIDCVLVWAGKSDGPALASALELIDDPEPTIRWKAMDFLFRASPEQLEASLSHLLRTAASSHHIRGIEWLLSSKSEDPAAIVRVLQSQDPLLRKYAVAAAARLSGRNREPLLYAASVDDPDVKEFAETAITLL